ncbi:MAG: prolipoprotein diacylglyceryl transferase [Caldisericia bacterium]
MEGLSFLGIIIFNIPAVFLFAKSRKLNFWRITDLAAPSIAIGYFFGRLGCFFNGCCYGPESHVCSVTMDGISRFPTQLVNATIAALIFLALWWFSKEKRLKAGELFVYFIYFYAVTHIGTEFLRADPGHEPILGTFFNAAQWGNVLLLIGAGVTHRFLRKSNTPSMVSDSEIERIEEIDRNAGKKPKEKIQDEDTGISNRNDFVTDNDED